MADAPTFDVVVVGGGAAGCVVAARLAESGSRSVLLLEAGPDLREATPDVFRDGWHIDQKERNWGYVSEPNPRGNTQNVWRTKALGGTGWLTRFAPRGHPGDYGWGDGWAWDDVLPYFIGIEADADYGHEPWHGDGGPMPVRRYLEREYSEVAAAAIDACVRAGFPQVDDHNRPGAVGVGRMPISATDGRRVTTADAYLPLDGTPASLTIRADAAVDRIAFDGNRACGVRLADGDSVEAGEVVLCAGVYGSPPILMRSGIGEADHLRALAIEPLVDLPAVGANLADHPVVAVDCGWRGPAVDQFLNFIATWHADGTPPDGPPDLVLWCNDPEDDDYFEVAPILLKPHSRGRVRLRSADPSDPPVIELPALSDERDVARLLEGYERALEVANDPAVRKLCSAAAPAPAGRAELVERIRNEARSLPHVVGTCAMGEVVDPSGRVHGVEGLKVADASVMPDVPSGFTHFPTIMVAERLAALA